MTKNERIARKVLLLAMSANADPDWTGQILKALKFDRCARRVIRRGHLFRK